MTPPEPGLARRLGTRDAVVIGLGSMVGAGVFAAFGPAARAAGAGLLVLTADLREVIGFSSFGVLVYYLIANIAAWTQPREQRRWPRALNVLGAIGCTVLAATLPLTSVIAGLAVFAIGVAGRLAVLGRRTT